MGISGIVVRYVVIGCALLLGACGGGGDGDDAGSGAANTPAPPPTSGIGPAGGTVTGPNGTKVVIPAGALAVNTPIAIAQIAASAIPLPSGFTPVGATFAFTPHGTTFAVPVTVTLPFDPASVPAGRSKQFIKTNAQNQWQEIPNAVFGATSVSGQVTSFSDLMTAVFPGSVRREWSFFSHPGTGGAAQPLASPNDGGIQPGNRPQDVPFGETVSDIVEFRPGAVRRSRDRPDRDRPADQIANGHVFGSVNGITYGVLAEAPNHTVGGPEPVGSITKLTQRQVFQVTGANPSLTVKLTKVRILLTDFTGPPGPTGGVAPIKGQVFFDLSAKETSRLEPFFEASGHAVVFGADNNFFREADPVVGTTAVIWNNDNFNFPHGSVGFSIVDGVPTLGPLDGTVAPGACPGTFALLELKESIPIDIPI